MGWTKAAFFAAFAGCSVAPACPPGQLPCGTSVDVGALTCADVSADRQHCGGCGSVCSATEACVGGRCVAALCTPSSARCLDASTRAVCSSDGQSESRVACAQSEVCDAFGVCRTGVLRWAPLWTATLAVEPQTDGEWHVAGAPCTAGSLESGAVTRSTADGWDFSGPTMVRHALPDFGGRALRVTVRFLVTSRDARGLLTLRVRAQYRNDTTNQPYGFNFESANGGLTLRSPSGAALAQSALAVDLPHTLVLEDDPLQQAFRVRLDGVDYYAGPTTPFAMRGYYVAMEAQGSCAVTLGTLLGIEAEVEAP